MKFIFISDLHLSGYTNDKKVAETNLSERLNSLKISINNLITYSKEKKIHVIVIGGDTLHNKSIIHTVAQNVMLDFIRSNKEIKFIIIDGNHDLDGKGENVVSALTSLNNEPNVQRIGTEVGSYLDEKNDILYVPYSSKMVEIVKNGKAKILVSHFGLNEGVLASGLSVMSELKLSDLTGRYELVLLGHYHTPQQIVNENINLFYAGSLIHLNWNDKNEVKRFLVVDTEEGTVESIPTSGYKRYIELKITEENKKEIVEEARKIKADGHLVNIRKDENVKTDDISDEFVIVDRTEKDISNRGINTSMTENEITNKYLEIKGISKEDLPMYQKVVMDIIANCSEVL